LGRLRGSGAGFGSMGNHLRNASCQETAIAPKI
jgi:hypothetical protein